MSQLEPIRTSYDNPFIDTHLKETIIRLNRSKGVTGSHADTIIHKLKRIESNDEFSHRHKGEKSYRLSQHEKSVTINLVDFEGPSNNRFTVTNQFKQSITNTVSENEKHIIPVTVLNAMRLTVKPTFWNLSAVRKWHCHLSIHPEWWFAALGEITVRKLL